MTCLVCNKPAVWTRHTQFAGDHPYCEEHARKESDFKENDSYTYWTSTNFFENLEHGVNMVIDKGYELSTHEKQAEFASKRNEWDNWRPIKDL